MEKHLLSKSTFIRAWQCKKSIYLHKKRPFLRDKLSAQQRAKFDRGSRVGELARDLFPGGVNLAPKAPSQYQQMVAKTTEAINAGQEIIYEASFQYDRVLVILDILVKKNGKYYAYEVKSSKSISSTYLMDAALQYYVIQNSGLSLSDISIIHINPDYSRNEQLDLNELFSTQSVKKEVLERQGEVINEISLAKNAITLKKSPDIDIGEHCYNPYRCDFIGHCWKHLKQNSVFELIHLSKEEQFAYYKNGQQYIGDINENELDNKAKKEYQVYIKQEPYYNWKRINAFRLAFKQEFYMLNVIFVKPAVPAFQEHKPYQLVPALVQINDQTNKTIYQWELNPGEPDFDKLYRKLHQIKQSDNSVIVFSDQDEQTEFLKSIFGARLYNMYDLFFSMDYIDYRLQGDLTPQKISKKLFEKNPFTLKEIPDKEVAAIKLNKVLFENQNQKNDDIKAKVKTYSNQFVDFQFLLLSHINEQI